MANAESAWLRWLSPISGLFVNWHKIPAEDCGDWMIHGMLESQPGAMRMDPHGKTYDPVPEGEERKLLGSEEAIEKLWKHTVEETKSRES